MKNKINIIAEIGVNHDGSISKAKKMIKLLSNLDIDAIKIQAYTTEQLASKNAELANYQKKSVPKFKDQFEMLKKYELSKKEILELDKFCNKYKQNLIASVFSVEDFQKIKDLSKKQIKIPSGELLNYELINIALDKYEEVILSTGLSDLDEIKKMIENIKKKRKNLEGIAILHCTSSYPCPEDEVNIAAIKLLKKEFNIKVGYSDHTIGSIASVMAISLGAKIIEKHVTLDDQCEGPDHKASTNMSDFKDFVSDLRTAEKMLGDGNKTIQQSAIKNKKIVEKSIYSKEKISKGEKFTIENLQFLRPGGGIPPEKISDLVGKIASRDYFPGEILNKKEL
tara:strand:+ start:953 stop:1969 length:1017 start_codon:yes stop_codon:yes gene_type:complete